MIRTLALSLALVAAVPFAATAHGPSRQKVNKSIEINAPAGAKRTLTLKGGGKIEEALTRYDAASKTLGYEITNVDVKVLPIANYSSTLSVAGEGGKSTVTWKGAFYRGYINNDPPPELSDEAAVKAVTGVYDAGLAAIKAKAEAGG